MVPNCPRCQIIRCQIVRGAKLSTVPNCPLCQIVPEPNFSIILRLPDLLASINQWLRLFGWEDYGERVNPHNPPNGQGMPHQSPLAPTLLPLLVKGGGVELAEGSPSSWSCWFHGASLIWHLHAVASGQRVIDNSKDIHLELSMTRLTSDHLMIIITIIHIKKVFWEQKKIW